MYVYIERRIKSKQKHTNLPVGMCTILTALSVVLTCCPPAPLARNVSIRKSRGSNLIFTLKERTVLPLSHLIGEEYLICGDTLDILDGFLCLHNFAWQHTIDIDKVGEGNSFRKRSREWQSVNEFDVNSHMQNQNMYPDILHDDHCKKLKMGLDTGTLVYWESHPLNPFLSQSISNPQESLGRARRGEISSITDTGVKAESNLFILEIRFYAIKYKEITFGIEECNYC